MGTEETARLAGQKGLCVHSSYSEKPPVLTFLLRKPRFKMGLGQTTTGVCPGALGKNVPTGKWV